MDIAVITGASSGIGKEFFLRLDKDYNFDEIWLIARRKDKLLELKNNAKNNVRVIALDLGLDQSYQAYKDLLEETKPNIKFLVNASGFGKFGKVENIPLIDSLNMINVNCKGLVAMTELSLPYINNGGKIIQIGSLSSFQPVPYQLVYGSSKAFVLSYSRALNVELRNRGILVMAVCPGWVKTEFFDTAWKTNSDKAVCYYNKFYTPLQVVDRAMKDLKKGKDLTICGAINRAQVFLVKLLPAKTVMKTWLKQQKHKWKE